MLYDHAEVYLENTVYKTRPSILHGNGLSKNVFNSLSNYLGKAWSPIEGSLTSKENTIDLDKVPSDKWPKIVIGIMVPQETPFLEDGLEKIALLNYPKKNIHLFIYNSVSFVY